MFYNVIALFVGSGIGGVLRWLCSQWLNGNYPWGTLTVNVAGCFLIAFLAKHAPGDPHLRLLLTTGFCGGFTTFSTFINENFLMLRGSQLLISLVYMALSLLLGLLAAWIGYRI